MSNTIQRKVPLKGIDQLRLFGLHDRNLRKLEQSFDVTMIARGNDVIVTGLSDRVRLAEKVLVELILLVTRDQDITENDLDTVIALSDKNGEHENTLENDLNRVILYTKDGFIKPKSAGQHAFYEASAKNDIVFAIGPAGTGKTFLAVAMAVAALRDKLADRIVLTRPAVEAGERLGYLPGDFREKIDPYLRPLYDALNDMIPADKLKRYLDSGIIEIVPLAYMRGRTLNNAFVILDEAQNTKFNQMKMFLTRLGINAKAIITGDITQSDLPSSEASGLVQAQTILHNIEGIKFAYMNERDVVRHRLVRDIIKAYDNYEGHNVSSHSH